MICAFCDAEATTQYQLESREPETLVTEDNQIVGKEIPLSFINVCDEHIEKGKESGVVISKAKLSTTT